MIGLDDGALRRAGARHLALAVEDLREVLRDARAEQVDRHAAHDVVDAEGDGRDGVQQPADRAGGHARATTPAHGP